MFGVTPDLVYQKLPIALQEVAISIYGFHLGLQRYGSSYRKEMERLHTGKGQKEDWRSEQLETLNEFLAFAGKHSAYYKRVFAESGLTLPLTSVEQLKVLPVLEKETLRTQFEDIRTDVTAPIIGRTGGTTGKSLQIRYTKEDLQRRIAHVDFFKEQHGFKRGMRRASFSGRHIIPVDQTKPVYWRYNRPLNQMLFSIMSLSKASLPLYVDALNDFAPEALDGVPSVMVELANYIKQSGKELTFKPLAIFPTSETLTDSYREILEEVFGAPVYDQYGSSEGAPLISECTHGNMHLHVESGFVEQLDETNEVVITSFLSHGTPLIRYRIGDMMNISEEPCSCGGRGTVIASIEGRTNNFLDLANGKHVPEGLLISAMSSVPNSIIQIQYRQLAFDHLELLLVTDDKRYQSQHATMLEKEIRYIIGPGIKLTIRTVDAIPREANGKLMMVKRLVSMS